MVPFGWYSGNGELVQVYRLVVLQVVNEPGTVVGTWVVDATVVGAVVVVVGGAVVVGAVVVVGVGVVVSNGLGGTVG